MLYQGIQNFEDILRALKESYKKTQIYKSNLSLSPYDKFKRAITLEDLFLLELPKETLGSIVDVSIYQAIAHEDFEACLNGFFLYGRLDFYNRIPYLIKDWSAVNSFITNDARLLAQVYKDISYDEEETSDAVFYLLKNLLRAIICDNDEWKRRALDFYAQIVESVASAQWAKALINCLKAIAQNEEEPFCSNFLELLKLSPKIQWMKTVYNKAVLFKYCNPFILGIYNLAQTKNIKCALPEGHLLSKLAAAKNTYKQKPPILFDGDIAFLNDWVYDNFGSHSKANSDRILKEYLKLRK